MISQDLRGKDSLILEDIDMEGPVDTSNVKKQKDVVLKWFNWQYI
jgi:hypothetical protein